MIEVSIEDSKVVFIKGSVVQEVNHVNQEVKHEKKYTIEVQHVDFLMTNFVFESKVAYNFLL